jgi:hypothetical protein
MRLSLFLAFLTSLSATPVRLAAQDLAPRAYVITPVHSNAINVTAAYFNGGADFNGAAPITNATGRYNIEIINLYHSLSLLAAPQTLLSVFPMASAIFKATSPDKPARSTVPVCSIPRSVFHQPAWWSGHGAENNDHLEAETTVGSQRAIDRAHRAVQ